MLCALVFLFINASRLFVDWTTPVRYSSSRWRYGHKPQSNEVKCKTHKQSILNILYCSKLRVAPATRCLFNELFEWVLYEVESKCWKTKGLFTWRWVTPGRWDNLLRWGNPPVRTISHLGRVFRNLLPNLSRVPYLHVNRP